MDNFFIKLLKNPYFITLILAIAISCAAVYGVLKWLDVYTRHNIVVIVPDVKGLKVNEAAAFFENNKLRYNVIDSVYSQDVPPGAIVELYPSSGSKVKEERIVFLTINAFTAQMAAIPDVEDLSFRQAYAILRSRGFTQIEVKYVAGRYKDLAIDVETNGRKLKVDEKMPLDTKLLLRISSGHANPDSLQFPGFGEDGRPVQSLNSEDERWF
ncbi:PASTA domain-containing protein [Parabacteroides sp. PF5-9]|uniref:PASTA domain-containing protein n=1 Tax=Parabacteroides sp. PF5-9 TaxID=1742404 RepID=UPI0024735507|nr:PASTA domain-containing protein [Parabacteroides sp. PF5-9]MDH6357964.1 beta-lactam-binding protein with PASTA domain [Parabacteroides sp. PF5-9]